MLSPHDVAVTQVPNTLEDVPVMTKRAYARAARASDAPLRFATSRSGVPAPIARPGHVARICGDALRIAGIDGEAVHLNLAAPPPHASGWAGNSGFADIGATSLNRNFTDWMAPVEDGHAVSATVLSSIPGKAEALAEAVESEYGPPPSVFPNLETGVFTGQALRDGQRARLRDRWGLERTRELYGSSEAAIIAAGDGESRRLVPLLNHLILEIEVDGDIVDIRDVPEPTVGSLLVTDPARTAVPLRRYRQGDMVRVHPGSPLPRLTPLGRADDAIDLAGAILHPSDLFAAIEATMPDAAGAAAYVRDRTAPTTVEVFVSGQTEARPKALSDELLAVQPALEHAVGPDPGDRFEVTAVESLEVASVPGEPLRPRSVRFESDVG